MLSHVGLTMTLRSRSHHISRSKRDRYTLWLFDCPPNVGVKLCNGALDLSTGLLDFVTTVVVFILPENKITKLYSNLTFNLVIVIRQIEQVKWLL